MLISRGIVLNEMKIAVWDVQECQREEFAVSGQKIEQTKVDADRGHENGNFSEYSVVVDEFLRIQKANLSNFWNYHGKIGVQVLEGLPFGKPRGSNSDFPIRASRQR